MHQVALSFLLILLISCSYERAPERKSPPTPKAGDVVFIPDYHTDLTLQAHGLQLRDQARQGTLFISLEGIPYEPREERSLEHEIGMESSLPLFFCGMLAHHARATGFHLQLNAMPKELRRFYLSQFIAILIRSDGNLWKEVVTPKVLEAGDKIDPDLKEFYELVNPVTGEDSFKDPKAGPLWVEANQDTLERLSKTIGVLINAGANYIFPKMIQFTKENGVAFDTELAVAVLTGRLDAKSQDAAFARLNAELREPFMKKYILLAREEAKAKGAPLVVFIGASHVAPLTREIRAVLEETQSASKVLIDDALLRKVNRSTISGADREILEKVLGELDAVKNSELGK